MQPITTTAALADFCKQLNGQTFVVVDTEFMRETTYWPKLCLIQVAAENCEACIDPLAEDMDLTPLLDILRVESVQKVFHAARQDVLTAAYATTPERFVRRPPRPPALPTAAWINKPDNEEADH